MLTSQIAPQGAEVRGHNEGSVYFRKARAREKRGRWYAAVSMPMGGRRERPVEWWDNTEARAREILKDLIDERDAELVPTRRLTVGAAFRSWIAEMERSGEVKPTTLRSYRYVESRLSDGLRDLRLSRLGPTAVETWLAAQAGSARTVALCRDVFRAFANDQVRARRLIRSPMVAVSIAPVPAHRATVLSAEQAKTILEDAAPDWYHALWVLLLATGLRISEALGLTWDDFDRTAGTLHVEYQLAWNGKWERTRTKAQRTLTVLALPRFAVDALIAHERRMATARKPTWKGHGQVFVTPAGLPPHKVNDELTDLCTRLGLPRVKPHELRHAHLTLLADAGVPEDVRERRAGHSTTAMARRYTSQAEQADRDAATALETALG